MGSGISPSCVREITESLQAEEQAVANRDRRVLVYRPDVDPRQLFMVLHIVDPDRLFDGLRSRRLQRAVRDSSNLQRMLFLHQQLRERGQHVKVTFRGFDTEVVYLDKPGGENGGPTNVFLHFEGDFLAEDPNLSFVSVMIQLVFNELRLKFENSIEPQLEEAVSKWKQTHSDDTEAAVLLESFYELLRLRTAWHLTTQFYITHMPAAAERHPDAFFQERYGSGIWLPSFEFFEKARLLALQSRWAELDAYLMHQFQVFYDVDPAKVELLWPMPLPGRWEFALASPPVSGP